MVMPSNRLILCRPLLLPPSVFPSIRVFSNESVLRIKWPKYWSFSLSISPHRFKSLGQKDPLEKEMATHSSILAWEIPWKEEPGRLQPMGSQRISHNLATKQQQQYIFIHVIKIHMYAYIFLCICTYTYIYMISKSFIHAFISD